MRSHHFLIVALFAVLTTLQFTAAASSQQQWIESTDSAGDTIYLADNRRPALYTGNFGDCLGSSLVNVTRFDAAFYKDNMTIMFHLAGNTALANESLMMYIGVYAYGESRFDLTFNPCSANIASLCPMNRSVPIEASGIIPIDASDLGSFPVIAYTIPDFEGEAILRIFANSTESEIGCYSAQVTNGASLAQPQAVGTVFGIFTIIAIVASFATAIYGESIPIIRTHYAHSLSVMVVFAVFQHIFFTGALSMNWPSVLVAFWSNYAWTAGMINTSAMQSSINRLIGNNIGNTSEVGAAGSGTTQESLGGGYDISAIYKRGLSHIMKRDIATDIYGRDSSLVLKRDVFARSAEQMLHRRSLVNASTGYKWYGNPVPVGLPLPGNYSGFAGTLAEEGIRVSNAFMTGFLWFLILLAIIVGCVVIFKWVLEGLVKINGLRKDRLAFFRKNWIGYTMLAGLRTCYIGFFPMMLLTMFQFSYSSSGGVKGIAAIVFAVFFLGIGAAILFAYVYRAKQAASASDPQSDQDIQTKGKGFLASTKMLIPKRAHDQEKALSVSGPIRRWTELGKEPNSIHEDEEFTKRFGWLASRFRRSRWWFFGFWSLYEFVRACFYAGASGHPMTQVFGLLIVEILAFAFTIWVRPFEGKRLNVLVVYALGFSKVTTVALSAAFDISFELNRIITTAIGIIIVVIQGLLTVLTLVAIVVGAVSSYMSLTRNQEGFKPHNLANTREKYFMHLDRAAHEAPRPRTPPPPPPEESKGPYFNVGSVRRVNKIEDDDADTTNEMHIDPAASHLSLASRNATPVGGPMMGGPSGTQTLTRRSRAISTTSANMSRTSLPFGARQHRPSWSTRDFQDYEDENPAVPQLVNMDQYVPEDAVVSPNSPAPTANVLSKKSARSSTMPSNTPLPKLRTAASSGSIRSTHDMDYSPVPVPRVRPRSGTWTSRTPSRAQSRAGTPVSSAYYQDAPFSAGGIEEPGERMSRAGPLATAQEQDEELTRVASKERQGGRFAAT